MKLSSQQFHDTMRALHEFSDSHPDFNDRAGYIDGTSEAAISHAIWVLNQCFCEPNHITPRQRCYAMNLLAAVPPTVTPEYLADLNAKRVVEAQARRDAQRQAEREELAARQAVMPKVGVLGSKAKKAAERAARYESDPVFRAHCDSFGTRPVVKA